MRNSKHFEASIAKSSLRIGACISGGVAAANGDIGIGMIIFCVAFCIAELIGIIEELLD